MNEPEQIVITRKEPYFKIAVMSAKGTLSVLHFAEPHPLALEQIASIMRSLKETPKLGSEACDG